MAVVESELKMLSDTMDKVAKETLLYPMRKSWSWLLHILILLKWRFIVMVRSVPDFFRDIWRVETMRKYFDNNEIKLFREVLREGKEQGLFDIDNVEITADILHYCIKGIEVPYIRGQIGEDLDDETGWRMCLKSCMVLWDVGKKNKFNL